MQDYGGFVVDNPLASRRKEREGYCFSWFFLFINEKGFFFANDTKYKDPIKFSFRKIGIDCWRWW